MSLSAKYQAFLANPSTGALAEDASLHYITTLTSINDADRIVKHFSLQERLLKKKSEKVIGTVEGAQDLCLDIETTIEFVSGGGAYLPGLDDNFVADRTVSFPTVHIVHFNGKQEITQVRLYWDQGSLLKQIDVIGARARNWPIRDGKDQARLILQSTSAVLQPPSAASSQASRRTSEASRGREQVVISERPSSSASAATNATRGDARTTLSLFQPQDENQENSYSSGPSHQRAQSAKPKPREYSELFVGDEVENGIHSPEKHGIPVKWGGGKNFGRNRLFDETEEDNVMQTPMSVKTNSRKYNHFDFADPDDEQATPKVRETAGPTSRPNKHQSQWAFEDFVTPEKTAPKILGQAVRHFGWSDDEDETSPVRRPVVHKARPDADPHFEFTDDGTPAGERNPKQTSKGRRHNDGMGLYKDHIIDNQDGTPIAKDVSSKGSKHNDGLGLYKDHITHTTSDDEDGQNGNSKQPLGNVTGIVNNKNRNKDFGSQWELTDAIPNPESTAFNGNGNSIKHISGDRQKTLNSLEAHWGLYENSPEQAKKENMERPIKTNGNGMGGRKGTGRSWAIGDEDDAYASARPEAHAQRPEDKGFWDF
ncbi:hypothetical protein GQ43DRAFT_440895 [Delitschia confertaspora ATCC 74209]|uniref:NTF2 domain-containing protein n=1 Tax=Delitschia confertaspora ATCC 74209 TaxID=1513339 RepID=A0A9P4JKG7_9PLEO|nr:hypothetical protein GQ43DRAFT_440895 [Delitschia confertaspora ATCC 74209]